MRKHFAVLLTAMMIVCGCGKFNDIRITSAKLVSLTPSGLRAVNAVLEVGVDNPAMAFTVAYARGTVYYAGQPLLDYSAQPVTVKRRSSEVYEVNARGTLADGVSVLYILGLAGNIDLNRITVDIDATLKAGGRKKKISLGNVPVARIKKAVEQLQGKK
ncbi:MAG: LEA type 2 family protein [Candidatus Cryptobacteroides sp.]